MQHSYKILRNFGSKCLMNLTAENAFIGATVSKGVETLTVYKVNVKSFYAGKYPLDEFKSMYKFKDKSQTFKDFCKRSSILQYDYSGWEITEEEAAKKQVEEIKSAAKQVFSTSQKKAIKDTFEEYNKQCPCGYEIWSCQYCGKWTLNYYMR